MFYVVSDVGNFWGVAPQRRMPKHILPLTTGAVTKIAKAAIAGRYTVGGVVGLHLYISRTGCKVWVLRVVQEGKRRNISLGTFRDVSLASARQLAQGVRSNRVAPRHSSKRGGKPAAQAKVAPSFQQCAEGYIQAKKHGWSSVLHYRQWYACLKHYVYPVLGSVGVGEVDMEHVLQVLSPIWTTKPVTASRTRARMEAVLDYAQAQGYRPLDANNPARWKGWLDKVLPVPAKVKPVIHYKALDVLRAKGLLPVLQQRTNMASLALQLLVLTVVRVNEVLDADWTEFDMGAGVWIIPAHRMKARKEHRVALSRQAVELLETLPRLHERRLFPDSKGTGSISKQSLRNVLCFCHLDCTLHGLRSTFRDWAGDFTEYPRELAEAALAHQTGNAAEQAYRRKDALQRRRALMQDWADWLSGTAA